MKIRHLPCCALILLLLAGCAPIWSSDAMRFTEAGPVPVGMAALYIYRPHVETNSRSAPMVYLNDKKVVPLKDQGYTVVYVPPGSYVIRTKWSLFDDGLGDVKLGFTLDHPGTYLIKFDHHYTPKIKYWYSQGVVTTTVVQSIDYQRWLLSEPQHDSAWWEIRECFRM